MSHFDRSYSYRALRAVSVLQPSDASEGGPTSAAVSSYTGMSERRAAVICGQIASPNWPGGAWLYPVAIAPKRYRVSTLGETILSDAMEHPRLLEDEAAWADRMRWPWREEDSKRENVAIPTGGPDSNGWTAWARTQRFLEHRDDYDESEAARYLRGLLD